MTASDLKEQTDTDIVERLRTMGSAPRHLWGQLELEAVFEEAADLIEQLRKRIGDLETCLQNIDGIAMSGIYGTTGKSLDAFGEIIRQTTKARALLGETL